MKSIFLLCEYKIPLGSVLRLKNANITIEDIYNNPNCINDIVSTPSSRYKIRNIVHEIMQQPKEYSIYDLYNYGLSQVLVEKLAKKHIELDDINDSIKEDYKIGNVTYMKIWDAFAKFKEENDYTITNINNSWLLFLIKENFKSDLFTLEQCFQLEQLNSFEKQLISKSIEELVKSEDIIKIEDKYRASYTVYDLEKYGLSPRIIETTLVSKEIKFCDINENIYKVYRITPR